MATVEVEEEVYFGDPQQTESIEMEEQHFVNKRINESLDIDEEDEEEQDNWLRNMVDTREFRMGLASFILLIWAVLMVPYDIYGAEIHGDFVQDLDIFKAALILWLIGHICCIIATLSSLITLKYFKNRIWIINMELFLLMLASCNQVIGSILFTYSFCINESSEVTSLQQAIWTSCICKSVGLYIIYNGGFITYLGFIIFATKYSGDIPLLSIFCNKKYFADTNDDNPTVKFSKNYRISFLSITATIGMCLILVFGYGIYNDVGPSYQAIYIGYTFMLIATAISVLLQIFFHCRLFQKTCNKEKIVNVSDPHSLENRPNTRVRRLRKKIKPGRRVERVIILIVYFLIYAGIVMIFMYSLVSKIPEAQEMIERLRLIGNMVIITGMGVQISYELFTKRDNYDDGGIDHQYQLIAT